MNSYIRRANLNDLDFLIYVDLHSEGITHSDDCKLSEDELKQHREKILTFLTNSERGALILVDGALNKRIGTIIYCISHIDKKYQWPTIFHELDRSLFQADGRFLEIFQLWIDPDYRRMGYAMKLKKSVEDEAIKNGVNLVYTHTEERNQHVIDLNLKLGYKEVRRGPIWDEITRVSLVKLLDV